MNLSLCDILPERVSHRQQLCCVTLFLSPERDETEVGEDEDDGGAEAVEVDGRADDPDHDDAQREGDEAHAAGDDVGVVGEGLQEKDRGSLLQPRPRSHER